MSDTWSLNQHKISTAMRNGATTIHQIYLETGLSYPTIMKHLKSRRGRAPVDGAPQHSLTLLTGSRLGAQSHGLESAAKPNKEV